MKSITIAIDGYSACGKSTLAKSLAQKLSYKYIDSGAMYRAATLYALRNNIFKSDNSIDTPLLEKKMLQVEIAFSQDEEGNKVTMLNGKNVEKEIRTMEVSNYVSEVAKNKNVRNQLVNMQRKLGAEGGITIDGRDIGTVVFPNAELKLFITADIDVRTERRKKELKDANSISFEEVKKNLEERDKMDSNRKESPLTKAKDSVLIDNSKLTQQEFIERAYSIVLKKIREL